MTNESQPIEDPREVKRYDQLDYRDIVVHGDRYQTVRCVEPIEGRPGRCLILYVGGETDDVRGATEVQIATDAEYERHLREVADGERRMRMATALHQLAVAIEDGLPIPARFEIDGICMDSPDAVRAAATYLGVEAAEKDNGHRQTLTEAKVTLAGRDGATLPDVQVRLWHLSRPAPAEAVES
jgi:hypothetical protein